MSDKKRSHAKMIISYQRHIPSQQTMALLFNMTAESGISGHSYVTWVKGPLCS